MICLQIHDVVMTGLELNTRYYYRYVIGVECSRLLVSQSHSFIHSFIHSYSLLRSLFIVFIIFWGYAQSTRFGSPEESGGQYSETFSFLSHIGVGNALQLGSGGGGGGGGGVE